MNSVNLVGRLTRAPSVKFENEGSQVTTFTLLVEESGRDGAIFRLFILCVAWGKASEACGTLNSEDLVALAGKLCWRKQTDKHGVERSVLAVNVREVQVLESAVEVPA